MRQSQQRNKPKEPPKAPEKAPFFLPTLPGVEPRFAPAAQEEIAASQKHSRRLDKAAANSESVFLQKLVAESTEGDCRSPIRAFKKETNFLPDENFFAFAKTLSPAAIDLELRSLVTLDSLRMFICALTSRLRSHRDFEAVQAFQKVFLCMHADIIVANPELEEELRMLVEVQKKESERVLELVASSLGTLGFVRDTL